MGDNILSPQVFPFRSGPSEPEVIISGNILLIFHSCSKLIFLTNLLKASTVACCGDVLLSSSVHPVSGCRVEYVYVSCVSVCVCVECF